MITGDVLVSAYQTAYVTALHAQMGCWNLKPINTGHRGQGLPVNAIETRPTRAITRKCRKTSSEDWKTGPEDINMHTNSEGGRLTIAVKHLEMNCNL